MFGTGDFLIGDRLAQANFAGRRMDEEFALGIDLDISCAVERQVDDGWIGARSDVKIILELALRPVID